MARMRVGQWLLALAASLAGVAEAEEKGVRPVWATAVKDYAARPMTFALPRKLRVAGVDGLPLESLARAHAVAVPGGVVCPATGVADIRFVMTEQNVPASDEGYALEVAPSGVTIRARAVRGLFYGMQTYNDLVRESGPGGLACCAVTDWPDLKMRGLFLELNMIPAQAMPRLCKVLDALAALKYNTVLCDFADNFPLSISNDFRRASTFSRADIEAFKAAAKRNFINVIPKVQFFSHTWWMTRHRNWEQLREGVPKIPWCSAYCPRNPQVKRIVATVVKETASLLEPTHFHLGLDEIAGGPHGVCPRCQDARPADLLLEHVLPIERYLLKRGITPIVYHDEFCETIPTRSQTNYVAALDRMDPRVLVNLWQYEDWPTSASYNEIVRRGFKGVFMSYHSNILNTMNLPRLAVRVGAEGCILAYWLNLAATMDGARQAGCEAYPATVYQAAYSWNAAAPDIYNLPFDTHRALRRLLDPDGLPTFAAPPRTLSLEGAFNARIGGPGRRYPSLDAAAVTRLTRDASGDAARFALATEGARLRAVALAGGDSDAMLPTNVRIPLRGRAEGFSFLVAAAPENAYLFKVMSADKPEVGRLTLAYADGARATLALRYQYSINQWNAPTGGYDCRIVSRANDTTGAVVNLYAVEWANPHPDKDLAELDFSSLRHRGVAPLLFAVSAYGDAAVAADAQRTASPLRDLTDGPEPVFVPLVDFAKDPPEKVSVLSTDGGLGLGFARQVVDDPVRGKVLEIRLPALPPGKNRRLCVDVPIASDFDLRTFRADVYCDRARAIMRPDLYIAGSRGYRTAIDFGRGFTDGWTRLQVPLAVFSGREGEGAEKGDFRSVRIAFFLENTEPVTFRFGALGASLQDAPGRFDVCAPISRGCGRRRL